MITKFYILFIILILINIYYNKIRNISTFVPSTKKNVCLVFRGELLRNTKSYYHNNIKNKHLKEQDISEESLIRQDNIMKSIINNIILPYKKNDLNYTDCITVNMIECVEINSENSTNFNRDYNLDEETENVSCAQQ